MGIAKTGLMRTSFVNSKGIFAVDQLARNLTIKIGMGHVQYI